MAMEYVRLGDLSHYLGRPLPEREGHEMTMQLLEALGFMHDNGFAHRDLKPANIFVMATGPYWWLKVGDFGISKCVDQGQTVLRTLAGTPHYMAPEVIAGYSAVPPSDYSYTSAVDIWAVGVIAYQILIGTLPFPTIASTVTYSKDPKCTAIFDTLRQRGVSSEATSFVKSLLSVVPEDRPTARGSLQLPWSRSAMSTLSSTSSSAHPRPSLTYASESDSSAFSSIPSGRWTGLADTHSSRRAVNAGASSNQPRHSPCNTAVKGQTSRGPAVNVIGNAPRTTPRARHDDNNH
ncbi:kinase-like domain-containing protein [Aspergillus multicolor]|uniref:serine/threonine-protein kinase n=1 Tax=Aspergillus multicolor TaxID=41759 RepID=UPI003CCDAD2D